MKTQILRRRKKKDSPDMPGTSESDSEDQISVDEQDDEPEDSPEELEETEDESKGRSIGIRSRKAKPQKPKPLSCTVKLCIRRRIEPHLLFCEKHWRCVPSIIRNNLRLHYDPYAEKQSKEFFVIAKGALVFAKRAIPQPPFSA